MFTSIFHTDMDECINDMNNCAEQAMCNNNDGSFICTCNTGYSGNGATCSGKLTNTSIACSKIQSSLCNRYQ